MHCRRVQQLISPYLDQQLTGTQMLEMAEHLENCAACAEECESIRQVKRMLRALSVSEPPVALPLRIESRVSRRQIHGSFACSQPAARLQRGRRLSAALALSCFTILSLSAPFAPASVDAAHRWSSVWTPPVRLSAPPILWAAGLHSPGLDLAQNRLAVSLSGPGQPQTPGLMPESRQDVQFAEQYAAPSLRQREMEPLTDEASSAYAPADASLAGFQEP